MRPPKRVNAALALDATHIDGPSPITPATDEMPTVLSPTLVRRNSRSECWQRGPAASSTSRGEYIATVLDEPAGRRIALKVALQHRVVKDIHNFTRSRRGADEIVGRVG